MVVKIWYVTSLRWHCFLISFQKRIMKKKPGYANDIKKPESSRRTPEGDMDEHVHSRETAIGRENVNEDPDDRIHNTKAEKPRELRAEDHPRDPDDLVHGNDDEVDE